jgi:hypothetical protein
VGTFGFPMSCGHFFIRPSVFVLCLALAAGCSVSRQAGKESSESPRVFIDSFMQKIVSNSCEEAFSDIDIDTLINYGRPQNELYGALPRSMKARYRKDFWEGIYARLFRNLPREEARYSLEVVAGHPEVVDTTGASPRKKVYISLQRRNGGLKITGVEKEPPPAWSAPR